MKNTIQLEGFIKKNEDGLCLGNWDLLAEEIANKLKSSEKSKQEEDEYQTSTSVYSPKVFFRFYISDKKMSLEEIELKHFKRLSGALDIYTEWYGYSEYTIEGYNVENFTIGNHDLEKILGEYVGKYIHILIDEK